MSDFEHNILGPMMGDQEELSMDVPEDLDIFILEDDVHKEDETDNLSALQSNCDLFDKSKLVSIINK